MRQTRTLLGLVRKAREAVKAAPQAEAAAGLMSLIWLYKHGCRSDRLRDRLAAAIYGQPELAPVTPARAVRRKETRA